VLSHYELLLLIMVQYSGISPPIHAASVQEKARATGYMKFYMFVSCPAPWCCCYEGVFALVL